MRATEMWKTVLVLAALPVAAVPAAADTKATPANTWTQVVGPERAPPWSNLVYDPARKEVLHWGAYEGSPGPCVVQHLDLEAGAWEADYETNLAGRISADHLVLTWGLTKSGEAGLNLAWDQVCYDSKRKQVIYAGPKAMLAYDPVARKWTDLKAEVQLYDTKHAGGPPVYWGAMAYDPVNDEIVLFPHAAVMNWDDFKETKQVRGHFGTFVYSFKENLWRRLKPAVEPMERCFSRLAYDPKNQCLVMFGGEHQDRKLNDTWIYDCKTRTWHERKPAASPPPRADHVLVYDPKSGLIVMAGGNGRTADGKPVDKELWTYDVTKNQWQRLTCTAPWKSAGQSWMCAYDEAKGVIVLRFSGKSSQSIGTYVLRVDPTQTAEPTPWTPVKPERQEIPPDDPAIVAKLKALPDNTWVRANPISGEAARREWGTMACDPTTGYVWHTGGGHSTYTGDDIAIYQPGANRWIRSHRPFVTNTMGPFRSSCGYPAGVSYNGGYWTNHTGNGYAAADGRLYFTKNLWRPYAYGPKYVRTWMNQFCAPNARSDYTPSPRPTFVYDLATRRWLIKLDRLADGMTGPKVAPGETMAYGKTVARLSRDRLTFSVYDPERHVWTMQKAAAGTGPGWRGYEGTDFCYCPGREVIFIWKTNKKTPVSETWVYHIKANRWEQLQPKASPPNSESGRVLYVPDQDAVVAFCPARSQRPEQWVYSFKRSTWKRLEAKPHAGHRATGPYEQVVYSSQYGVFVWVNGATGLMRPDFADLDWNE